MYCGMVWYMYCGMVLWYSICIVIWYGICIVVWYGICHDHITVAVEGGAGVTRAPPIII